MPRRLLRDARTLAPAAQEEKRRTAIRLRQDGETFVAIGALLGVHSMTVSGWWDRFEAGGLEALDAQRRGRRMGTQRTLTPAQERTLRRLVADQTPDQLRMPFALWTRAAIGPADPAALWDSNARPHDWPLFEAVGLHGAEAAQAGV